MHHDGRKAGEGRIGGGCIGIAGIGLAQVMARRQEQQVPVQHRVGLAVAQHGIARQRKIGPGRQPHNAARHFQARVADGQRHGKSQPSARLIACQDDGRCRHALGEQPAIGVYAVAHRGGEEGFRRQPVLHGEGADAAGFHQLAHQHAMGLRRAGDKAAAMEIQDGASRLLAHRAHPFAGNGAQLAGREIHRLGRGPELGERRRIAGAHILDAGQGFGLRLRPERHGEPKHLSRQD